MHIVLLLRFCGPNALGRGIYAARRNTTSTILLGGSAHSRVPDLLASDQATVDSLPKRLADEVQLEVPAGVAEARTAGAARLWFRNSRRRRRSLSRNQHPEEHCAAKLWFRTGKDML